MNDDRCVHAEFGDEKIVRYNRAGKWYVEFDPANLRSARHISIKYAARRALELQALGGTIHFRLPGGGAFDRWVGRFGGTPE